MIKKYFYILTLLSLTSCANYQNLSNNIIDISKTDWSTIQNPKTGTDCGGRFFGIGNDPQIAYAIEKANISHVYAMDYNTQYILFLPFLQKSCITIYGE